MVIRQLGPVQLTMDIISIDLVHMAPQDVLVIVLYDTKVCHILFNRFYTLTKASGTTNNEMKHSLGNGPSRLT